MPLLKSQRRAVCVHVDVCGAHVRSQELVCNVFWFAFLMLRVIVLERYQIALQLCMSREPFCEVCEK